MNFLLAEIDSKKRALDSVPSESGAKYLKRSELERIRRGESESATAAASSRSASPATPGTPGTGAAKGKEVDNGESTGAEDSDGAATREGSSAPPQSQKTELDLAKAAAAAEAPDTFQVSNNEAVRRLRLKGQPIRLFGETDKERRLRLRALELIEERTEGGTNEFARALERVEEGGKKEEKKKKADRKDEVAKGGPAAVDSGAEDGDREPRPKDEEVIVDVTLVRSNPHKIYPQIYHALKRVLKEWEQSLEDRPDSVKRSTQGKIAAATQATSAEYLKPLFKSLRKRDLAPDVLQAIAEITYNMQIREYLVANDAYLRLSIGNAPWPIGVTMVGIHERSGREKIFSNNVAHVLNDETSRKYIQSLKRLLTFAQTVRPPADLSQKMG
ncbi:Prp18-domain-containing protein [Meredithblackwellia eburnea MCA 4105]